MADTALGGHKSRNCVTIPYPVGKMNHRQLHRYYPIYSCLLKMDNEQNSEDNNQDTDRRRPSSYIQNNVLGVGGGDPLERWR